MNSKSKNVCVIGGSGFLGSHVCDQLSDAGYKVKIFDITPSKWIRDDQVMHLGDITNEAEILKAVKDNEFVYNFAGLADLNEALEQPKKSVYLNVLGNVHALEACREASVKRYVYARA
jgi:UDP-glucose 4-epimerase